MTQTKRRIFLGTIEIAGYYGNLAKGLRAIGEDVTFWELTPHPFNYDGSVTFPFSVRLIRSLSVMRGKHINSSAPIKMLFLGLEFCMRLWLFIKAIFLFDSFIFGFRQSFLGGHVCYVDLAVLNFFGKRVICVYHGSDSRPPYIDGTTVHHLTKGKERFEILRKLSEHQKKMVTNFDRWAHVVIDNPHSGHFHTKRFVNCFEIGAPFENSCGEVATVRRHSSETLILHAPSDRAAKGSDRIAEVVLKLKNEGYAVELIEISGRPHKEVIQAIINCDFVIDQLYSDTPMAGFAREAAGFGKPAIVCGYINDPDLIGKTPTHFCHPDELETAVKRLINDPDYRENLGKKALKFSIEHWSTIEVARHYVKVLDGDIPPDWWYEPSNISNVYGACLADTEVHHIVTLLLDRYGPSALQLDDKPVLMGKFLQFSCAGKLPNTVSDQSIQGKSENNQPIKAVTL